MPSDIMEPTTPSHFHEDIRITPEKKQFGFMPEGSGDSRCLNIPVRTTSSDGDTHWESSLFSSSLSELFSRKLRLPRTVMSANREEEDEKEETFESLEAMEAQTIGNLLPDEDDFFADVIKTGEDLDDFDLFSSVGGMELDGEGVSVVGREQVSSRILFVKNVDSLVDDYELKVLFERYGDVRALHTSGKNHGFILVSYYDIRAAQNVVRSLHGRLLRGRKLDIHYQEKTTKENANEGALLVNNLDSSISNEELRGIVSSYGEIREVRRTMHEIYIEFFDVRAAEAALRGLNECEIAGRQLKLTIYQSSIGFPPSTRVVSASKPVGFHQEPTRNPFENPKTGIQSMPNLYPDYLGNFAAGISPYQSSTRFSEMVSGNVHGPHPANLGLWSNSDNPQQHNPSSAMMWPNSMSRGISIPSQRIPPITAFSRASPVHHHIGSAPVLNSPFWDRRQQVYAAESPETSGFLGSLGFPDGSSHKAFSHVSGNSKRSSRRMMPHHFYGRSQMLSVPDLRNERYKNLSHRRSDSTSSNAEKKLYELDVDRILRGEDNRTTLMVKNIPNKYTSKMLLAAIDEYCKGTYDFLYLPIDFKNKCNVGYAFINLTEPENIVPLYKAFNGKKWEKFNSEKVASLAYGRIQGKSALIAHFQNSSLMNEDKRCRPILFHTAGPNAGDQEPFPMGSNIRTRPGRHRSSSSIENYANFGSGYENRGEYPNGMDSI